MARMPFETEQHCNFKARESEKCKKTEVSQSFMHQSPLSEGSHEKGKGNGNGK